MGFFSIFVRHVSQIWKIGMEESMEMDVEKNADYYDRYSRQYFTFGKQAMNNLGKSNVFISGMGGLGVEIGVKNSLLLQITI